MKRTFYLVIGFMFCFAHNSPAQQNIRSELLLLNIKNGKERILLDEDRHFEAPNWSRDGSYILINSNGKLEKIDIKTQKSSIIETQFANNCNNDHGFTFDGKWLILSHNDPTVASSKGGNSRIFIVSHQGGTPRLITSQHPSYWHGVSPDGQWITYCALRNGEWDVYKQNIFEEEEIRLTDAEGLDDGPEYSYDGQWIFFNSHRTGRMHIYKMKTDGSHQTQLTFDEYDNWFPHPSPDNQHIVYISYLEDQKGAHPFGKDVKLRLMNTITSEVRDITPVFFGGQGSLNVHSWSPDGKYIAYVRYSMIEK